MPGLVSKCLICSQTECDGHGARLLDRYVKFRKLAQLVRDIASMGSLQQAGGGLAAEATLAVDPRQASQHNHLNLRSTNGHPEHEHDSILNDGFKDVPHNHRAIPSPAAPHLLLICCR